MPNPGNTIKIDGNYNIVVQDATNGDITINTNDAEGVVQKLEQLNAQQIAALRHVAKELGDKLPNFFNILLQRVATQKNVVAGNISNVQSAKIGDESHYHFYPEGKNRFPKKLTLDIPTLSPDAIVGRTKELNDLHQLLTNHREALLLNGLGGIRKTTLAQVYTQLHWDDYQHIA